MLLVFDGYNFCSSCNTKRISMRVVVIKIAFMHARTSSGKDASGSGIRSSGLAMFPDVGPTFLMLSDFLLLFLCTQPSSVRYGPEDQDG